MNNKDAKREVVCWCFICGNKTTLNIFVERLEKNIRSYLGECEECGKYQLHVFDKDKVSKKFSRPAEKSHKLNHCQDHRYYAGWCRECRLANGGGDLPYTDKSS